MTKYTTPARRKPTRVTTFMGQVRACTGTNYLIEAFALALIEADETSAFPLKLLKKNGVQFDWERTPSARAREIAASVLKRFTSRKPTHFVTETKLEPVTKRREVK